MQSKLIDNLKTKKDTELLREEVDLLMNSIYKSGESNFENILQNNVRYWVRDIILKETQGGDKEEYLQEILKKIDKIKHATIVLAYEPNEVSVNRFYEIIQSTVANKIVLELLYDPQIVGGAVISYGGRYKDFSFRRIFEDELEDTRDQVIKLLNNSK